MGVLRRRRERVVLVRVKAVRLTVRRTPLRLLGPYSASRAVPVVRRRGPLLGLGHGVLRVIVDMIG
jgi:hypothetical protein